MDHSQKPFSHYQFSLTPPKTLSFYPTETIISSHPPKTSPPTHLPTQNYPTPPTLPISAIKNEVDEDVFVDRMMRLLKGKNTWSLSALMETKRDSEEYKKLSTFKRVRINLIDNI